MRSICKKGSVTLVAVLALCVVASASASASQWYVGGKALTGSEKLAETVNVVEPVAFKIEESKITCTGVALSKKAEIAASGVIKLGEAELSGCKLIVPKEEANCTLGGGSKGAAYTTESLEAKMGLGTSPQDTTELTAANSTKTWFAFRGGSSCNAFKTEAAIKGKVTLEAPTGQTEAAEQEFVAEGEAGKGLTWYEQPVYLYGKLKLKLASGKAWSFH